jgi:hypothetical protein
LGGELPSSAQRGSFLFWSWPLKPARDAALFRLPPATLLPPGTLDRLRDLLVLFRHLREAVGPQTASPKARCHSAVAWASSSRGFLGSSSIDIFRPRGCSAAPTRACISLHRNRRADCGAIRGYNRICAINSLKRLRRRRMLHPPAACGLLWPYGAVNTGAQSAHNFVGLDVPTL